MKQQNCGSGEDTLARYYLPGLMGTMKFLNFLNIQIISILTLNLLLLLLLLLLLECSTQKIGVHVTVKLNSNDLVAGNFYRPEIATNILIITLVTHISQGF